MGVTGTEVVVMGIVTVVVGVQLQSSSGVLPTSALEAFTMLKLAIVKTRRVMEKCIKKHETSAVVKKLSGRQKHEMDEVRRGKESVCQLTMPRVAKIVTAMNLVNCIVTVVERKSMTLLM